MNKIDLKEKFSDGMKPTGTDFGGLIDECYNDSYPKTQSDQMYATIKNHKELEHEVEILNNEINKKQTMPFETNGPVTSYPVGVKGLFSPRIEGVEPLFNLIDNGADYVKWQVSGLTTKSNNGVHMEHPNDSPRLPITGIISDKTYTLVYNIVKTNLSGGRFYTEGGATDSIFGGDVFLSSEQGVHLFVFDSKNTLTSNPVIQLKIGNSSNGEYIDFQLYGIYEGDQTNNPNILQAHNYGIIPCAQNYELVSRGVNKLDAANVNVIKNAFHGRSSPGISAITADAYESILFIRIKGGKTYTIKKSPSHRFRVGACVEYPKIGTIVRTTTGAQPNVTKTTIVTHEGERFLLISGYSDATHETSILTKQELLESIQIIEGSTAPKIYTSYTSSKTEFSVPEDYPLVELPNGVKNYVNDNGEYVVNVKKIVLDDSITATASAFTNVNITKVIVPLLNEADKTNWGNSTVSNNIIVEAYNESVYANDTSKIGSYFTSDGQYVKFITALNTTADDLKSTLIGKSVHYQLAKPITLKDGEQGYKAPSSLQAFQNGDLVVTGIHKDEYTLNATKTITLKEKIVSVDYVHGVVDGKLTKLVVDTLSSDGKTITLSKAHIGIVQVKGSLSTSNYIYPVIKGDVPANLGTNLDQANKAISATNKKVLTLEDKMDLLLVLNS